MKEIKWTEVLVAQGTEASYWVRAYHSEDNPPSFEELRQAWLDEDVQFPYIEKVLSTSIHVSNSFSFTMENYSETFDTIEEAHAEMIDWLRSYSDEFAVKPQSQLSLSDSEDPVLDHLVLSYSAWCERENLPHISMDELMCEDITNEQRKQLTAFYLLWEELS